MGKNKKTPLDIVEIELDLSAPKEERIKDYIKLAGNPYLVRAGDVIVEMEYLTCGRSLQDVLTETMLYRSSNVSALQDSTKT